MNNIKKLIVIVGSGFAGINAAIQLRKVNPNLSILVIDSNSQFEFKPLLYEVFSDEIQSWEVIPSFDTIFANSGITFLRNTVKLIDLDEKFLILKDDFKVEFEYLILSTGSSPNDFSIKGVKEYSYFFNTNRDIEIDLIGTSETDSAVLKIQNETPDIANVLQRTQRDS